VSRLTRYELDQLYSGMVKNVIATYEMVQADEEKKVAENGPFVQNDGPNFDKSFNDPAAHPGLVSPGFGTSGQKPSGFGTSNLGDTEPATDFGRTGFGGSVYGSMEGYKGFGSSGSKSTKPKPAQKSIIDRQPIDFGGTRPAGSTPAPTGFGITPPAPAYTPYTPPALPQAPHQPFKFGISDRAPQPPLPGPAVSNALFGVPAMQPLPAPLPLPFPEVLGSTKRRPTPPGWRPMGLLDMNYVRQPEEKMPNRAVQLSAGTITTAPGELPDAISASKVPVSQNAKYGFFGDAWDKLTEGVGKAIKFTTEGHRYVSEFATALMEAPREDQLEFLIDFGNFLIKLIGPVDALDTLNKMIRDPRERTLTNVAALILALLPAVRAVKAGPKLFRFIEKEAKKLRAAKRHRRARNRKRPTDVQGKPVTDGQMKASQGGPGRKSRRLSKRRSASKLAGPPEFWNKYGEHIIAALEAAFFESVAQWGSKNPSLWPIFLQAGSAGATVAISNLDSREESQLARQFGLEVTNTALTEAGKMLLSPGGISALDALVLRIDVEESAVNSLIAGLFRTVIEKVSRTKNWNRHWTNLIKQAGTAGIEFAVKKLFDSHRRSLGLEADDGTASGTKDIIKVLKGMLS
jgi:hypothetical protein